MISLGKCNGSFNTADDLSTKICAPSKAKGVNIKVFKMIIRMNEAETLIKHTLCRCKCKNDSKTCNSNKKSNNNKCQCEYKRYGTCKKDCSWNPLSSVFENAKYLRSIADIFFIVWDKIMNSTDSASTNVMQANVYADKYGKYYISKCHEYYVNKFWW